MNKTQFSLVFTSALVLILIFTNPKETEHVDAVKSKLISAYRREMSNKIIRINRDSSSATTGGLDLLFEETFINKMTGSYITRTNFLIFSLTNLDYNGVHKYIGLGILDNVYLSNEINKILESDENKTTVDNSISIKKLEKEFYDNSEISKKKYLDKTLELSGIITEIDLANNSLTLDDKLYATLKENPGNIKLSQKIFIKGRFIGYDELLEELKMDSVIIIDNKEN